MGAVTELTTWRSADSVPLANGRILSSRSKYERQSLGRYRIIRLLGSGGMGAVYEAVGEGERDVVALKTLINLSPQGLLRFKQEFRRTVALSHPNLVSLYELGHDAGTWFFSMELVRGKHLLEAWWQGDEYPGAERTEPVLRRDLPQLLDAIEVLHGHSVLHLDIKPSNVLVTDAGKVKVLDFGLSQTVDRAPGDDGEAHFAGTPGYMAPEQVWRNQCPASDLYALGATLFQALAGRLPFEGTVNETLQAKQLSTAPRLIDVAPGVSETLAQVVDDLLSREPEARPRLAELRERLGLGRESEVTRSVSLPPVELIGRAADLERLDGLLSEVDDCAIVCHLIGASGVGKSTLLQAAIQRWEQAGALVMASRCFEWQDIPFKAADPLVDQLYDHLVPQAEDIELPADLAFAARMFPVLSGLVSKAAPVLADPRDEQARAIAALGELLAGLTARTPVVLCVDDAQWGDQESADLLAVLSNVVSSGLLVVLCQRPDSKQASSVIGHFQRATPSWRHVDMELGPLGFDDSLELARALSGGAAWSEQQLASIVADAEGLPVFIEQVVRFGRAAAAHPPTMEEIVATHLSSLDAAQRQLLKTIVVAQRPIPLRYVLPSLGQQARVHEALASLQAGSLVRCEGLNADDCVEPYHDRIRLLALATLSEREKARIHLFLAEALQAGNENPDRVAEHWFQGGQPKRAASSAIEAAQQACEVLAFERAVALYDKAHEWDAEVFHDRPEIQQRYAWALYRAGQCGRAGTVFALAARDASGETRLEMQAHAVEAHLVAGQVDEGNRVLHALLRSISVKPVARPPWRLAQLVALILAVRWKTRRVRRRDDVDQIQLKRANITWASGKVLTNVVPIEGIVLLLNSLLFALRSGDEQAIARGLSIAASGFVPFMEDRADGLLRVAQEIAERKGDPHLRGLVEVTRSTAGHMSGEWRVCLDAATRAHRHLRHVGVPTNWETSLLRANETTALEHLGDVKRLSAASRKWAATAFQRGDWVAYVSTISACGFAHAAGDDMDALDRVIDDMAQTMARWTAGYGVWHCTHLRLRVLRELRRDRLGTAAELVAAEWPLIRDAVLLKTRALRSLALELRALVELEAPSAASPRRRRLALKSLIRDFERTARRDAPPFVAVLRGALAYGEGRTAHACADLRRAAELYSAASMQGNRCMVEWQLAKLWGDAAEQQRLEAEAAQLGIVGLATWARFRTPGYSIL